MNSAQEFARGVLLLYGLFPPAMLAAQQPDDNTHHTALPSTSFWLGAQIDFAGLQGPSGSPALVGGQGALARRFAASPWEVALVVNAASRHKDAPTTDEPSYEASTFGLYGELRYIPGARVYGPYVLGTLGLANTRVDDRFGGLVPGVGTDATTAIVGGGLGLRFRMLRVSAFADLQYQVRRLLRTAATPCPFGSGSVCERAASAGPSRMFLKTSCRFLLTDHSMVFRSTRPRRQ